MSTNTPGFPFKPTARSGIPKQFGQGTRDMLQEENWASCTLSNDDKMSKTIKRRKVMNEPKAKGHSKYHFPGSQLIFIYFLLTFAVRHSIKILYWIEKHHKHSRFQNWAMQTKKLYERPSLRLCSRLSLTQGSHVSRNTQWEESFLASARSMRSSARSSTRSRRWKVLFSGF